MTDHSELKKLAEWATPGPWKAQHPNAGQRGSEVAGANGLNQICADLGPSNALFIAAANPEAVLALISENEKLRKAVKFSAEAFSKISSGDGSGHADLSRAVLRIAGSAMSGEQ